MSRLSRRRRNVYSIDRRLLFGAFGLAIILFASVNCSLNIAGTTAAGLPGLTQEKSGAGEAAEAALEVPHDLPEQEPAPVGDGSVPFTEDMWADVTDTVTTPRPAHGIPSRMSLDVKDADLLDVLSLIAYKLEGNIIFLGEPATITIKTEILSPITTLQTVLQKVGYDYLTLGSNYIVGEREKLHEDFYNRMMLTRFDLYYVSADSMEGYIEELGIDDDMVQKLTIDTGQHAIWMQGTPMVLGKAREIINKLDIRENVVLGESGARKIRMPVATASGPQAAEELEALIDLLSILLDGFRDDRTDMGWVTWDHPDPVPSIYMDWESPVIKPYDIKMKITRDIANDHQNQLRYLIAEGTADNIELVNQMIEEIAGTPGTPFTFDEEEVIEPEPEPEPEPDPEPDPGGSGGGQQIPDAGGAASIRYYSVELNAVPNEGGKLTGRGTYMQGAGVTVQAAAGEGYEFVRWIEGGSEVSTNPAYTFSIAADRSLEAVFKRTSSEEEELGEQSGQQDNE